MTWLIIATYFGFNLGATIGDVTIAQWAKRKMHWLDILVELLFAFPILVVLFILRMIR